MAGMEAEVPPVRGGRGTRRHGVVCHVPSRTAPYYAAPQGSRDGQGRKAGGHNRRDRRTSDGPAPAAAVRGRVPPALPPQEAGSGRGAEDGEAQDLGGGPEPLLEVGLWRVVTAGA
ncbi:hypothetical protein HEK616_61920 [Streptomyces nigrescens]|uniref:Uncharacterized protein n=1 Tax=Streptomyces nigrescens TaxID=1920 RepID=A0ABM8A228_STRNI|nr:hypothetical protein HEK616_61920 [Streptomyces nigrescens]